MNARKHYDNLLGPVYAWSSGGIDAALKRGRDEITSITTHPSSTGVAVDLGAGFGAHAIPLAEAGYRVLALDFCSVLLAQLRQNAGLLSIECIKDDVLEFDRYLSGKAELILCMGDTLMHLDSEATVASLVAKAADALSETGRFVVSFRDYSAPLRGADRFMPVRCDDTRMLTCFLEYVDTTVRVYDLLHEWGEHGWEFQVSHYDKLRLSPAWLIRQMESQGLTVKDEPGLSGMIKLSACRQ